MKTDKEKAEEVMKKRALAAKGLAERKDGKPIDPMQDVGTLDIDMDADQPETTAEKEGEVAHRGLVGGLAIKRSG